MKKLPNMCYYCEPFLQYIFNIMHFDLLQDLLYCLYIHIYYAYKYIISNATYLYNIIDYIFYRQIDLLYIYSNFIKLTAFVVDIHSI